jgi:RHS repeat-associated protein
MVEDKQKKIRQKGIAMNYYIEKFRAMLGAGAIYMVAVLLTTAVLSANGQEEPPQPNYVEDTLFDVDGMGPDANDHTINIITRSFSDGQGRKLQSQTLLNNTTKVLVSGTGYNGYDEVGRPVKTVKPFAQGSEGHLTFITEDIYKLANQYYQFSSDNLDSAYSSVQFWDDPLGRPKVAGAPGVKFTATNRPAKTWYFGVPNKGIAGEFFTQDGFLVSSLFDKENKSIPREQDILNYIKSIVKNYPTLIEYNLTVSMDANGNFTQVLKDMSDKILATWSRANDVQGDIISKNSYDALGRLIKEIPPATDNQYTKPTTYSYNSLGQVESKTTPDAGTVYNYYDDAGRLNEVINANDASGNTPAPSSAPRLHYEYDMLGRNTVISRKEPLSELYCTWIRTIYDDPTAAAAYLANSQFPTDQAELNAIIGGLTNTRGRVVASISYDQGFYAHRAGKYNVHLYEKEYSGKVIDLYSYDDEGRVIRKYKSIPGIPLQTVNYVYDMQGKIKTETIGLGDDLHTTINTSYFYNEKGQLSKITRNDKEFVRYGYDEVGRMYSKTFLYGTINEHTVTYRYNIRDWTNTIQIEGKDHSVDNTFSEEICYETNTLGDVDGFMFEPQYNGNIGRARSHVAAKNNNIPVDGADVDLFYSYDNISRLIQVRNNKTYPSKADYEGSFTYLNDGRILNKNEGTAQQGWGNYLYYKDKDNLCYTNQLKSILSSGKGDNTISNYIYDYNGNMVLDRSKKMAVEYDWRDMPVSFYFFSEIGYDITTCEQVKVLCANKQTISKVVMLYDASGNRVKKESGSATIPSGSASDLLITNTQNLDTLSVTTDGILRTNRVFTDLTPDGAFTIENYGVKPGVKVSLSGTGLQVAGKVIEGNDTWMESGDMQAYYSSPANGTPANGYPHLEVNKQGEGVMMLRARAPVMTVDNGAGYVDNSHVFVKNNRHDPYFLSYVNIAEGVSRPNNDFEFYIKDHLGSTRAVLNETWQMQEAMGYLAYGAIQSLLQLSSENKARQKFTGKELDEDGKTYDEHGAVVCAGMMLNYFGARYYDSEIGKWTSVDRMNQFWSPYSYVGNGINPLVGTDPDGNAVIVETPHPKIAANGMPYRDFYGHIIYGKSTYKITTETIDQLIAGFTPLSPLVNMQRGDLKGLMQDISLLPLSDFGKIGEVLEKASLFKDVAGYLGQEGLWDSYAAVKAWQSDYRMHWWELWLPKPEFDSPEAATSAWNASMKKHGVEGAWIEEE